MQFKRLTYIKGKAMTILSSFDCGLLEQNEHVSNLNNGRTNKTKLISFTCGDQLVVFSHPYRRVEQIGA